MKFTRYAPDRYTLTIAGSHSLVAAFTHRRCKHVLRCHRCRAEIASGAEAYRENVPSKERIFVNGVVWCAACVEGT